MKTVSALLFLFIAFPGLAATGDPISHLLRLPVPDRLVFCGETVPLDREDVLERLDLELIVTLGSPIRTTLWLKRAARYFPLIEQEIKARGLPDDLKYVAPVESNLRASAASSAGAVGPWQFIRSTGEVCGLERTQWRDERRDWVKATRAALDHLAELRELLGSWPLALAAYNAGERRVTRALNTQAQTDFYGLRLPRETERYVFRALAAKLVLENPAAYGIDMDGARRYPPVDTAVVPLKVRRRRLAVAVVAQAAGASYRWFLELNPWIRGSYLPRGTHRIVVPAASEDGFETALAHWRAGNPEPKTELYRVRRGDNLSAIARRHNVRLADLCAWNGLNTKSIIQPGQKLVVQRVN